MSVYWLTFRLAENSTYNQRYEKFTKTMDALATRWWIEPSSFYLFESTKDIDAVAVAIRNSIDPATDVVLVGMSEIKSARVIGKVTNQTLFALMPFTKKV